MQGIFILALVLPVVVVVYWAAVPPRHRSMFLLLCSLVFMAYSLWEQAVREGVSPLPNTVLFTGYFLVNLVITYTLSQALRQASQKRPGLFKVGLFWLIGNLAFFKYINRGTDLLISGADRLGVSLPFEVFDVILPVGVSYIIFRMIHYLIESYRGKIKDGGTLVEFGAYVFFFPTYRSGPVDRFTRFYPQTLAQKKLDVADINYGLFRIIGGLIKKVMAADPLRRMVLPVLLAPLSFSSAKVVAAMYGLAIQVYMDFSGYTDLAVGTGRLFGYKVMENFNLPYFKPNLAELWRNWHISVYSWIRDYFFLPLFAFKGGTFRMYLGVLLTFVVFMLWHEGSWRFAILGVYHGVGMMVWTYWHSKKRTSPSVKALSTYKELRPVWTFLSFTFYGFGFVFFVLEVGQVWVLVRRVIGG